ncbi:nucleoside deaminase [Francisella sp. SYW-9]|uniref:nucleoside deaminase n=1 Tax=Francisella sp. SYW-9 TaxID=2610888 RepID=UPI00123DA409|nr:nucleoside deaminase [Francisella sp. SYW-9]
MDKYLKEAIVEAKKGSTKGGIPIGSVLVIDDKIVGAGHNQRVQKGSCILHAEMDCLENAGRLKAKDYKKATLYTTLSPCPMCSGAILLYGIKKVIVGENINFMGQEELLKSNGIDVQVLNDRECIDMMQEFIDNNPDLWNEDIGE